MAFKCFECGWSDKPSHKRYFDKKGLNRPICEACNPSLSKKRDDFFWSLVFGLFGSRPGGRCLAMLPYVLISSFTVVCLFDFFIPFDFCSYMGSDNVSWLIIIFIIIPIMFFLDPLSYKFAILLEKKRYKKEPFAWLIFLFFLPLIIFTIGFVLIFGVY